MNHFDTIINSKKERVPIKPNIFSFIGYDKFRYPFVTNYCVMHGYSCYVRKSRHGYSVITVGWTCSPNFIPTECYFDLLGEFVLFEHMPHVASLEVFSDVVSCLAACVRFDVVKDDYTEFLMHEAERIAYENHDVADAEAIIADKFGDCQLELF